MPSLLNWFLRLGRAALALFLIFFACRLISYHWTLMTFPFADTFREGAMMSSTDALVKGLNPYAMSLQPQLMNPYGIIYPLLVWPLAKLFGTTIFAHRLVTALSIIGACALMFVVLQRNCVPLLLNFWAVGMMYASCLFPGTSTATIDPGATGMLFLLLTVFYPWAFKFSYPSLIVSVVFGLLAFYTKPYALLGAVIVGSYLFFFVSRTKGFFYGLLMLGSFSVSAFIINKLMPAYFDNCFFASLNMAHSWASMGHLYMQIKWYLRLHLWTLILMGLFLLMSLRAKPGETLRQFTSVRLILWAGLWAAFVLYASLGRHTGATLWYFFQLLSPFLLMFAAWMFSRYALWPIVCVPLLILNLFTMSAYENYKTFQQESRPGWTDMALLVGQHAHILNSPLIAPLLVEQNKEVTDNGQSEYFLAGAGRSGLMGKFFKIDEQAYFQGMLFFKNIRDAVENKAYDLVILQPKLMPLGIDEDIKRNYKYEGSVVIYEPQDGRPYELTVWKPLSS